MKYKLWFNTREKASKAATRYGVERLTEQRFLDRVTKKLSIRYFIEVDYTQTREDQIREAFDS